MVLCLLVSSRFQVLFHSPPGVLFTFPSRYYSLSVTWSYLAFWDGPHFFRQDFSCPDVLRITLASSKFRLQEFHLLCSTFPGNSTIHSTAISRSLPHSHYDRGLGFSDFARHYFRNLYCFLFLRVLRCFSSPGSLHTPIDSVHDDRSSSCRVPPFRHPRLNGYLLLPAAFRSLSRLSSALSAKASALCPILLDLSFPHHVAS